MLNFNIEPAHRSARKEDFITAQTTAREASAEIDKLQTQVHKMNLLLESMWNLLKEKTGLKDDELKEELKKVKLHRAEEAAKSHECTGCGKAIAVTSEKCVFCGTPVEKTGLF